MSRKSFIAKSNDVTFVEIFIRSQASNSNHGDDVEIDLWDDSILEVWNIFLFLLNLPISSVKFDCLFQSISLTCNPNFKSTNVSQKWRFLRNIISLLFISFLPEKTFLWRVFIWFIATNLKWTKNDFFGNILLFYNIRINIITTSHCIVGYEKS